MLVFIGLCSDWWKIPEDGSSHWIYLNNNVFTLMKKMRKEKTVMLPSMQTRSRLSVLVMLEPMLDVSSVVVVFLVPVMIHGGFTYLKVNFCREYIGPAEYLKLVTDSKVGNGETVSTCPIDDYMRVARDALNAKRYEMDSVLPVINRMKNVRLIDDMLVKDIEYKQAHETRPLKEEMQLISKSSSSSFSFLCS
ncbi:hypothetical protein GIB67_035394 [Kingdonia uniflora]|uniref:Uncharacterized protein n=1 Tax=Kingdonia uniflora TaxID=39325 RepID=A0A7J7MMH3_9MAGN|nr:hypothetical protein GIB67_035394 [Kingdonia uniflora]